MFSSYLLLVGSMEDVQCCDEMPAGVQCCDEVLLVFSVQCVQVLLGLLSGPWYRCSPYKLVNTRAS